MNEHVELLVPVKANTGLNLCKIFLWVVTVLFALLGVSGIFGLLPFIVAIAAGTGAYFVGLRADIEYEYILTDRDIDIDVIYSKQNRKHVTELDLTKLEIMAPLGSHRLDGYAHRELKKEDYSSRMADHENNMFVMIYDGSKKIVIEPDERLYKAIYNGAPSKVFKD